MKILFILLLLYSCAPRGVNRGNDERISKIDSTLYETSKQNGFFTAQDAVASYDWIDWKGERQRMIIYDSVLNVFQILDWYKRDTIEEAYAAFFIKNKVSLVTVTGRGGKGSSGSATYHIDNYSILRKKENGREIDNLKFIIRNLNQDAAKLYDGRKKNRID